MTQLSRLNDQTLLVANRGEIARRVLATAHRLGMVTVAVYGDPDADAPFVAEATTSVRIGPADLSQSYLSVGRLLEAAVESGATAVHPGYGFLSENAEFARAVVDAGLIWVGPHPEAIDAMGLKTAARRLARAAGVPIIPGFDQSQDPDDLAAAATDIGYPVLIKAAAGGGGKGIRIVEDRSDFSAKLNEARTEAERSFGNGDVIVERYITRPRHVEVQIVGDKHGSVIDLGTRECSVQRRYQKLLEEAPAPNLPDDTRAGLRARARDLGRSIDYDSAGTVEFIVDDDTGEFFFLEMNTRLQVEHPVTEYVTGLDLVELQLRSAVGQPLPLDQDAVTIAGHAFEARVNAEDPAAGFTPQIGTVSHLEIPDGVRWDSAVVQGSAISPHYDPMVAKLIVGGPNRTTALVDLRRALDRLVIGGLTTNTGFHRWLVDRPELVEGRITTRFLDETEIPVNGERDLETAAHLAAAFWRRITRAERDHGPWHSLPGFTLTPHRPHHRLFLTHHTGPVVEVSVADAEGAPGNAVAAGVRGNAVAAGVRGNAVAAGVRGNAVAASVTAKSVAVNVNGATHTFTLIDRSDHWAPAGGGEGGGAGAVLAPFPAVVAEVPVAVGDEVNAGQVVVVIEAMKMLHSLPVAGPGTVAEIRVKPGDQVESNQVLITFDTDSPETGEPDLT